MARDSLSSRVMARDSLSSRVQLDTCNLPNNFCTACMHPFFSKSDQEAQGKPIEVCLHSFVGVIHSLMAKNMHDMDAWCKWQFCFIKQVRNNIGYLPKAAVHAMVWYSLLRNMHFDVVFPQTGTMEADRNPKLTCVNVRGQKGWIGLRDFSTLFLCRN